MKCEICKRELGNKHYGYGLFFIGYKNINHVCEECDLSISEQISNLMEEIEK